MLHGSSTVNNRNLNDFKHIFRSNLPEIEKILDRSDLSVLDIGCGTGQVLKDMKKIYQNASLYGIDIQRPQSEINSHFKFIEQSIESPLAEELKFDLIYSIATFPYIDDVAASLRNIARALKPDGLAIIKFEPFYLGPHGFKILQNPGITEWSKDLTTLSIKPGDGLSIMQGLHRYEIPKVMQFYTYEHLTIKGEYHMIPAVYNNAELNELKEQNPTIGKSLEKAIINWEAFEFLEVRIYNPKGGDLAGKKDFRPYKFAAPRVYLKTAVTSYAELVNFLLNPENYDRELCKSDYKISHPAQEQKMEIQNFIKENPKIAQSAPTEKAQKSIESAGVIKKVPCPFYATAIVLGVVLAAAVTHTISNNTSYNP